MLPITINLYRHTIVVFSAERAQNITFLKRLWINSNEDRTPLTKCSVKLRYSLIKIIYIVMRIIFLHIVTLSNPYLYKKYSYQNRIASKISKIKKIFVKPLFKSIIFWIIFKTYTFSVCLHCENLDCEFILKVNNVIIEIKNTSDQANQLIVPRIVGKQLKKLICIICTFGVMIFIGYNIIIIKISTNFPFLGLIYWVACCLYPWYFFKSLPTKNCISSHILLHCFIVLFVNLPVKSWANRCKALK